jgi:hypothetical protein
MHPSHHQVGVEVDHDPSLEKQKYGYLPDASLNKLQNQVVESYKKIFTDVI